MPNHAKGVITMNLSEGDGLPVESARKVKLPYKLMPYQRQGVDYLKGRKYSLLADSMGL